MVRPLVDGFRRLIASQRAESGMGALLIFIASILVAAVAAGVIIQSTYMAQQRAQSTAELSVQDVSDGWKVLSVEGEVDSQGLYLTHVFLKSALHAGSYPLDLQHTVIEITDGSHEGNLYLDEKWNLNGQYYFVLFKVNKSAVENKTTTTDYKYIKAVANTSTESTIDNDVKYLVTNANGDFTNLISDTKHYYYYVFVITTFHIEDVGTGIKVYNVTDTNNIKEITNTATELAGISMYELKLGALVYAAKSVAKPGISYTVIVIRDPINAFNETTPNMVVTQGAVLKLVINVSTWNIKPQTHVTIKLMPKHGVPTLEEFWTPPTYARQSYISLT